MGNALALASVTAVLKDLLDNALIDRSVSAAVGGSVTVSVLAPDRIETGENESARLNLFLYQVAPNAALRNLDQPARDARGRRTGNPPLALDLHYLLTAYGGQDFEAEILLGYAMQILHETPVLDRAAIRNSLLAPAPVDGAILPPALAALAAADLAEQIELVRIAPHQLNTEEISKLWTAFQAKYRPSTAYVASVVLIESTLPVRSPLPVLTRGAPDPITGKERGVVVQAGLVPPYPTLAAATPPDEQPAVRMGELLSLSGHHLDGDAVAARCTHLRSGAVLELDALAGAAGGGFRVRIPPDPPAGPVPAGSPLNPANWQAGVYSVAAVVRRAGEPERASNALPLVLAPRVEGIAAAAGAGGAVTVTLDVSPPLRRVQRARLLVGEQDVPVTPLAVESAASIEFTSAGFPSGNQWLRLRVDEAESLLVDRTTTPPSFDASQQVAIP